MNINSLIASSSSALGSGTTTAQAASAAKSASPLLAKAEKRIQSALDAGTAQLSKFGLLKSALADGQTAAQALSQLSSTATPAVFTTALGAFFKTFNAAMVAGTVGAALASLGQHNTALTPQQKALKAFEEAASA
jgi:hypothetical protein